MPDLQASFGVPTEIKSCGTRLCKVHGLLPISEFYSCQRRPKGTNYECKACHKLRVAPKHPRTRAEHRVTNGTVHCSRHGLQRVSEYYIGHRSDSDRPTYTCKKCQKEWQENHRETARRSQRDSWKKLRLEVLSHYSPDLCCDLCGEAHYEFLALDHINGCGVLQRAQGYTYMLDLKRQGFPGGFRVLCHNCNLKHGCRNFYSHTGGKKPDVELKQTDGAIRNRRYGARHPERVRARARAAYYALKADVLGHYGDKCACCGNDDLAVLSIDHAGGWGAQHRRALRAQGKHFSYGLLKSQGYPDGFQVLCMNCNLALGFYGYCPHAHEKREAA